MRQKINLRKLAPKKKIGMDDQRGGVLRNAFSRNFEQTFHKDQMDMTKEIERVRERVIFYLYIKQLCGKFIAKNFRRHSVCNRTAD
jgi:hypothetical protein